MVIKIKRMRKFILILCLFPFLFASLELCSQTYITPYIGTSNFEVSNNDTHSFGYPEFANNSEYGFGFGVTVDHYISQRFSILLNLDYERLSVITSGRLLDGESREFYYPSYRISDKYNHNRYSLGLGGGLNVLNNVQVSYLFRLVRTPSILFFANPLNDSKRKQPSDLLEFAHRFELSYQIKRFLVIGYFNYGIANLSNRNLTNQNYLANSARIDTGRSFGVKIGYRFQILEKFRRHKKSKVNCPKF